MPDLGKIVRTDPREIWPHEARDLTPWLAQHLNELGEALGLDLDLVEQERDIGDFSADIIARDLGRDRLVVIENQLEMTDHGHLGQLLTYCAGVEAGAVVWVSREFRDEHRKAIDWLNRGFDGNAHFFAVQLEVLRIDTSRPALNFRLVAAPNDWSPRGRASSAASEPSQRRQLYQQFFQRLIDTLRETHRFTNAKRGQPQSWYSFSSGTRGLAYGVCFAQGGRLRTELYIDTDDAERNEQILRRLEQDKPRVETEIGEPLEWQSLDTKRACRVAAFRDGSIDDPQDRLDEYLAWATDRLLRFKRVFGPMLPTLANLPTPPSLGPP